MIINAVALAFIVSLDELISTTLFSDAAKHMMDKLEAEPLHDSTEEDSLTMRDAWDTNQSHREWSMFSLKLYQLIFPVRLFSMLAVTTFFIMKYYAEHCIYKPDGSYVAKDLRLPKSD